jgi:WD40 repeat protein
MDKIKDKHKHEHDDDDDEFDEVVRLVPVRTYLPKTEVDFAGASYFAGQEDEFILVPTKSGDILFWDQDSGVSSESNPFKHISLTAFLQRLLHALRNKDVGDGDLTSVAWNYASKRHMLASACHDGSVRIWTSSTPERDGTRGKDREHTSITLHPYGLDHEMDVSISPMNMSRRPTSTDGAHHTHGEPSTYMTGRTSLEGSTEGAGPSFVEPMDRRERRRVESPLPAELAEDKNADSNPFIKMTGRERSLSDV